MAKWPKRSRTRQKRGGDRRKKTDGEANSNALPGNSSEPATTSPHDISERKCDTPSSETNEPAFHSTTPPIDPETRTNTPATRCVSRPRTRSIAFSCIFKRAIEINPGAIATSPPLPSPKMIPYFPVKKKKKKKNMTSPTSVSIWMSGKETKTAVRGSRTRDCCSMET